MEWRKVQAYPLGSYHHELYQRGTCVGSVHMGWGYLEGTYKAYSWTGESIVGFTTEQSAMDWVESEINKRSQ